MTFAPIASKIEARFWPAPVKAVTIAIETKPPIRPYSIAVAPLSSRTNSIRFAITGVCPNGASAGALAPVEEVSGTIISALL